MTTAEVLVSRGEHGSNVLTPPPRTPGWKLYLAKFDDPVIRILLIAAGVAVAVGVVDGQVAEGIGILVAVFLATFLAYWNESRAARAFDILNTTGDDVPVKVIRDGGYRPIPKREVVVGDIVFLEVGEEVPADGELTEAVGLLVNESRLTGESLPADKVAGARLSRGATAVDGYGHYRVDAVGDRTEIGRTLTSSLEENEIETPLNKQLAKLSEIIGVVGFGIAGLVFVALAGRGLLTGSLHFQSGESVFLGVLTFGVAIATVNIWLPILLDAAGLLGREIVEPSWLGGKSWGWSILIGLILVVLLGSLAILGGLIAAAPQEWIDRSDAKHLLRNFMIAVTIIVVAVPEGLAMSVTLSLAYSMRKMTAGNTLVRRMHACETIGAATVICSDKTGTLTQNQMRVFEAQLGGETATALPTSPELRHRIIEAIAVNSTAQLSFEDGRANPVGNPTEGALLLWLHQNGVDIAAVRVAFTVETQWIFNTERKFMATLGRVLHVKGAPEIVLERCTRFATADGEFTLDAGHRANLNALLADYQSRGLRVLGFAVGPDRGGNDVESAANDLCWLGLISINDPVRAEVPDAIRACRAAGVVVKIVTGDNAETASEIARQIGLDSAAPPMTGPEFAALTDEEARQRVAELSILARARPADKFRLVRLLQERGEVVAVTGDGVNDGPALNRADVGLAMGKTGTAVAREASDIVLLDDSFPSIVNAIRWGRALYENIQRFILFQLTINVAALGLATLGPFVGVELPLTVMQMLWVNLIMDTFAALALATEPPHDGVLARPPRSPGAFIVTPAMAKVIFVVGSLFLAILLGGMLYWQSTGELPDGDEPSRAGTLLFTGFVLLQFWNLFNAKAFGRSGSVLLRLGDNPSFLAIAAAIFVGQVLLVQFGGTVFRTVPLSLIDWLSVTAATSLVLVIGEIRRQF